MSFHIFLNTLMIMKFSAAVGDNKSSMRVNHIFLFFLNFSHIQDQKKIRHFMNPKK